MVLAAPLHSRDQVAKKGQFRIVAFPDVLDGFCDLRDSLSSPVRRLQRHDCEIGRRERGKGSKRQFGRAVKENIVVVGPNRVHQINERKLQVRALPLVLIREIERLQEGTGWDEVDI